MKAFIEALRSRLILKIIFPVAFILFASIFLWSFYHLRYQQDSTAESLITGADRVCSTVKLGLHYAMMLNSREDIQQIVNNYSKLKEIRDIRILNKNGQVMFASNPDNALKLVSRGDPLCQVCHQYLVPKLQPARSEAIYRDAPENGERVLRIVSPILNEQGCSSASGCHFHKASEKILGVLDLAFSLEGAEEIISESRQHTLYLAFI